MNKDITMSSEMFMNGDADGLFQTFSDIIMLNAQGFRSKVVYVADYSDTGDVIIGRPEFASLKDLKGKTVSFEGIMGVRLLDAKENADALKDSKETISLYCSGEMVVAFLLDRGQLSRKPDMGSIFEPRFVNKDYN